MDRKVKNRKKESLLSANATVFTASFCIMVLELTAGRIIAPFLGVSLYTWTAVIGVVLTGIALGNYTGGVLSDRFPAKKLLSLLFFCAALTCFLAPAVNKAAGSWYRFMLLPVPFRIALHVSVTFFFPSLLLGMVAPVVAKFALDKGLPTGKTVGTIYAWSATGSIFGVFSAGFFLIPNIGTLGIILGLTAILIVLALLYGKKAWFSCAGAAGLALLCLIGLASRGWPYELGRRLSLRQEERENLVYRDQSYYSHIQVYEMAGLPGGRKLRLNQMLHSVVDLDNPADLDAYYQYPYLRIYAGLTHYLRPSGSRPGERSPRALTLGGGGYVFPRYIQKHWPGSLNEVVEIDPAVTRAAEKALGFDRESGIKVVHMDARNYINRLLAEKEQRGGFEPFDIIYGDALSDLSVPYQLTTHEYNQKIKALLAPEGAYIVTIIDSWESGKFLAAMVNTLKKSFSQVEVFQSGRRAGGDAARNVFVVAAFKEPVNVRDIEIAADDGVLLEKKELERILKKKEIILTDTYAPTEALLEPVVHRFAQQAAAVRLAGFADRLMKEEKFFRASDYYQKALELDPVSANAYNNFANFLARQGYFDRAIKNYRKAIRISPFFAEAYLNLGIIQTRQGDFSKAAENINQAIRLNPASAEAWYSLGNIYMANHIASEAEACYQKAIENDPEFAPAYNSLGNVFFLRDRLNIALKYYRQAVEKESGFAQAHNNIGTVLARRGNFEEAVYHFRRAVEINPAYREAGENLAAASRDAGKKRE